MAVPATVKLVGAPLAMTGSVFDVHTTQKNPLGTRVQDDKGGEYIYLKGIGSVALGSWVTFDEAWVTALLTANAVGPVAIAMGAVIASTFGWFCTVSPDGGITGACDTIADNKACFIDGTDGRVDDAVVTGDLVLNAWSRGTDTSNLAVFQIVRPSVNDVLG